MFNVNHKSYYDFNIETEEFGEKLFHSLGFLSIQKEGEIQTSFKSFSQDL